MTDLSARAGSLWEQVERDAKLVGRIPTKKRLAYALEFAALLRRPREDRRGEMF